MAKKLEKYIYIYIYIYFYLYFLEGWSLENRRQKKLEKYIYGFFYLYFWRAGRGKIGGQKTEKCKLYFLKIFFFWRAGCGKIGGKKWKDLSCCDAVLELALGRDMLKMYCCLNCQKYRFLLFSSFSWETNGQEHWEAFMFY